MLAALVAGLLVWLLGAFPRLLPSLYLGFSCVVARILVLTETKAEIASDKIVSNLCIEGERSCARHERMQSALVFMAL